MPGRFRQGTFRPIAAAVVPIILATLALVGCGSSEEPPRSYMATPSVDDVVGFRVGLAGQVDLKTPGPLPDRDSLSRLLDALSRSPVTEFAPESPGELVAVVLSLNDGTVLRILAGPGFPPDHALVELIRASQGVTIRNQVSSSPLSNVVKSLARERLSAQARQTLDPGGRWLGE